MTRQAIREGAEFVLWPESSTPFLFEEDLPARRADSHAGAAGARADPLRQRPDRCAARTARRSTVITTRRSSCAPTARPAASIARCTCPVRRVRAVQATAVLRGAAGRGGVAISRAGDDAALLPVGGHLISIAICYEVVYPDLVRQFVAGGSELLTTITNDAWFGPTSAPYQHFEQASMRAIENGRYLVRSANTGISGIVDPYGRVLARTDDLSAGGARRRGAVPADVDLLHAPRRRPRVRVGR